MKKIFLAKYKSEKKKAFTIAEVLITLGIIGVVAAITIPVVVKSSSDTTYLGFLKKFQTTMQRVLNEQFSEENLLIYWGWNGSKDTRAADEIMKTYFIPRLQTIKYCGTNMGQGCGSDYFSVDKDYIGNWDNNSSAKAILADGMAIGLETENNCEEVPENTVLLCGSMMVDINGAKKPNKVGRDIFYFGIYSNGLFMPLDYNKTSEEINAGCKSGTEGKTCAAKVMHDSWQFKKDEPDKYPW